MKCTYIQMKYIKSCILNTEMLCTDVCDSAKFSQHRPSAQILNILVLPFNAGDPH